MSAFDKPTECVGYAAHVASGQFSPFTFTRRACGDDDVVIDIKFAGICHSDIHQAREEWGPATFPMVPGHEIGGVIVAVGKNVTTFHVGDHGGVGCMVESCRSCKNCKFGNEQYCQSGAVFTYNGKYKYPHCSEYTSDGGNITYGGYSKHIVVHKDFTVIIPKNIDLAAATPLLCAGITVYSPMIKFGLNPSMKFGVVGIGGLGHMAVKFGKAFGCHTTVFSRGTGKKDSVMNDLKADAFIDSTNADEMKAQAGTFDYILCTVSANYDMASYLNMLDTDGKFIIVGAPAMPMDLAAFALIPNRKTVAGSLIGGIHETQLMLDFCGRHNIVCDIELIKADQINAAYERTINSDVKYRFVIDTATI